MRHFSLGLILLLYGFIAMADMIEVSISQSTSSTSPPSEQQLPPPNNMPPVDEEPISLPVVDGTQFFLSSETEEQCTLSTLRKSDNQPYAGIDNNVIETNICGAKRSYIESGDFEADTREGYLFSNRR